MSLLVPSYSFTFNVVVDMSGLRSLVTNRLCIIVNLVTKKSYLFPTSLQRQHSQPHYKYVSYQNFGCFF